MGLKKIQLVAQFVGFVTIGLLSISGVLAIASAGSPAWAALGQASPSMSARVPNVINYQGMLRRPDGSVINGTYTMIFRLYDSPAGGTVVHTETLSDVVVRDGLFTVLLGDGDGNPIQAVDFKDPLYVGIQVENDAEMQPRQRIAPVPYAVQLTDGVYVDDAGNVEVSGYLSANGGLGVKDDYYGKGNVHLYAVEGEGSSGTAYIKAYDRTDLSNIDIAFITKEGAGAHEVMKLTSDGNVQVSGDLNVSGNITSFIVNHYSADCDVGGYAQETEMTYVANSICFLRGQRNGSGWPIGTSVGCGIHIDSGSGKWHLKADPWEEMDSDPTLCEATCLSW